MLILTWLTTLIITTIAIIFLLVIYLLWGIALETCSISLITTLSMALGLVNDFIDHLINLSLYYKCLGMGIIIDIVVAGLLDYFI